MKRLLMIVSMVIVCMTVLSAVLPVTTLAATNGDVKRTIAIVFDNSGSMYIANNGIADARKAWCRATYAMEAFATMMNASDEMIIYPMHPIEVNGKAYSSTNPLHVTQENASVIRDIYTPAPWGTPIETITDAFNGIQSASGDEKWLIVLTDGSTFSKNGIGLSSSETVKELEKVLNTCVEKINTMYLGIGESSAVPSKVEGKYTYVASQARDSAQVLSRLTSMCNMIFGRDTLSVDSHEIEFDVSMKKLILFIQGEGISDVSLGSLKYSKTDSLKYGTKGGAGQASGQFRVDETLQGVMLTYDNVELGSYELTYKGQVTDIVAYYEPDVDLKAVLKDSTGKEVDPDGELGPGTYYIDYYLVDRNGNPTESKLLGDTKYQITYSINDKKYSEVYNKAGRAEVVLGTNDTFDSEFDVTYLSGYKIHRFGADFNWPFGGFKIVPPPASDLDVYITGGAPEYDLVHFADGAVYRLGFRYEGEELSGALLDRVDVTAALSGGNANYSVDRDSQGYYVKVSYNNTPLETSPGEYVLSVTATYTNEYDKVTVPKTDQVSFTLTDSSGQLGMKLQADQTYYEIAKLAEGKPILIHLTMSGAPMTEEMMDQLTVTAAAPGLSLLCERVPGTSAYQVRIDPSTTPEEGKYPITVHVIGRNEIGREMSVEDTVRVEVRMLPLWLRILIPIAIILLILLLIWMYFNQKVLPNSVMADSCAYKVRSITVPGDPNIRASKGSRTKSITVESPSAPPTEPQARAGVTLTVRAISPRYLPSAKRKMQVISVQPTNPTAMISYSVAGKEYLRDRATGQFIPSDAMDGKTAKPFTMGATWDVSIVGQTPGRAKVFLDVTMKNR